MLHALRRSGADRNTTVAVVGLGPIGLLTVRLLAWLSYALIAGVAAALPPEQAIPLILVVWALRLLRSGYKLRA